MPEHNENTFVTHIDNTSVPVTLEALDIKKRLAALGELREGTEEQLSWRQPEAASSIVRFVNDSLARAADARGCQYADTDAG